jgi:hypothetical protein
MRTRTLFLAAMLAACSVNVPHFEADDLADDDAPNPDADDPDATPSDAIDAPIDADDGLIELIGRDWTVPAATDTLKCVRVQVPQDTYITELRGVDPIGTHHTVLTISEAGTPGPFDCTLQDVAAENRILFTSEFGGQTYTFPAGVGFKIAAGSHLTLTVHIQNTSAAPLTGHTAVRVKTATLPQISSIAEILLAGDISFSLPPSSMSTATGGCTLTAATTILSHAPHMHRYGTHQITTITRGGTPAIGYDGDYAVGEQRRYVLPAPLQMASGDSITVNCEFNNLSATTVQFGQSYFDEQCFAAYIRYPAVGGTPLCAN